MHCETLTLWFLIFRRYCKFLKGPKYSSDSAMFCHRITYSLSEYWIQALRREKEKGREKERKGERRRKRETETENEAANGFNWGRYFNITLLSSMAFYTGDTI